MDTDNLAWKRPDANYAPALREALELRRAKARGDSPGWRTWQRRYGMTGTNTLTPNYGVVVVSFSIRTFQLRFSHRPDKTTLPLGKIELLATGWKLALPNGQFEMHDNSLVAVHTMRDWFGMTRFRNASRIDWDF